MPTFIPAPKKFTVTDTQKHEVPFAIYTEEKAWELYARTFIETFSKGYYKELNFNEKGGIELYRDDTLAADAYRIDTEGALKIHASSDEGINYGLATALQILDVKDDRICLEAMQIEDHPDKDFRALMVDLGREWHPFGKVLKFVDVCFYYKIKYLQLHFADTKLYTLPSKAFPKLPSEGKHYTLEQIEELREYAKARGIVLIPEFECPGHAPRLNECYPEVFGDLGTGEGALFYNEAGDVINNKSLLCATRESAVEGVKTLLREMAEMFPDSPYLHIGGDEANIALWDQCSSCTEYMKKNNISDVYELYSDYVGRITSFVLSLGRTPIVWEGFPKKGSERIPKETIVIAWECHYQMPADLLESGFKIINAAWKPLYIVPGMAFSPTINWQAKDILDWNVYNWQHWWPKSEARLNPITVPDTDQLIGSMLCSWEMTFEQEISTVMSNLGAMSERVWTTRRTRTFEEFGSGFRKLYDLLGRIIQDV